MHCQISLISVSIQLLAPNGSSWVPAQARREETKDLCQIWRCFPLGGNSRSATVYLGLHTQTEWAAVDSVASATRGFTTTPICIDGSGHDRDLEYGYIPLLSFVL
jgi:hypothetical protein